MKEISESELRSSAIEALHLYRDEIAHEWASLVRKNIDPAARLKDFVLYNFFPDLIKQIASAIEFGMIEILDMAKSSSAEEHGGERARLTNYNITQLAGEYHYLKYAIFHVLESRITLSNDIKVLIDQTIDATMRRSLTAFALAEASIREKFVATLAHDVRGTLAFMKMAVDLIREESPSPSLSLGDLLGRMESASESALELIESILDNSAITEDRRIQLGIQQVNILDVLGDTAQLFDHEIVVQADTVDGYWCPKSLRRALKNVIENTVKYSDSNQPIHIHVRNEYDALKIAIHSEGTSIPTEEQENIFQPYWRAKMRNFDKTDGWGFGLPIARGVVEAHGGAISIQNDEAHGTTFNLIIPLDARPFQGRSE